MSFVIPIDVSQGIAAVEQLSAEIGKLPGRIEASAKQGGRKLTEEYDRFTNKAIKQMNKLMEDRQKLSSGAGMTSLFSAKDLKVTKEMHEAYSDVIRDYAGLEAATKSYMLRLGYAETKVQSFNRVHEKAISSLKVMREQQMAGIQAAEKARIATARYSAELEVLKTRQGQAALAAKEALAVYQKISKLEWQKKTGDSFVNLARLESEVSLMRESAKVQAQLTLAQSDKTASDYRAMQVGKEKLAGLNAEIKAEQKALNANKALSDQILNYEKHMHGTVAAQKEVLKGLNEEAIYLVKEENAYRMLQMAQQSYVSGKAIAIARIKEELKELQNKYTFNQKETSTYNELSRTQYSYAKGKAEAIAKLKEEIKELQNKATFVTREVNTYNELKRAQDSYSSGKAIAIARIKEELKELQNKYTFNQKETSTYNELSRSQYSYAQGKAGAIARLKEEVKELQNKATFGTREVNTYNELKRAQDSYSSGKAIAIARIKEELKELQNKYTFNQKETSTYNELSRTQYSYAKGKAEAIAKLKEEIKELQNKATFVTREVTTYNELKRAQDSYSSGKAIAIARIKEELKELQNKYTFNQKETSTYNELSRSQYSYAQGKAGAIARLKEEIKELQNKATFGTREVNTYNELERAQRSYSSGKAIAIARIKEELKELQNKFTYDLREVATYNELKRSQNAYAIGKAEAIARLKEEIKELQNKATFGTREVNTYNELERAQRSYSSGKAIAIARIKEELKELQNKFTYDLREVATYNELKRSQNAYAMGKAEAIARLREEIKELQNKATFGTRETNTYNELERAQRSYSSGKAIAIARIKEELKELQNKFTYDLREVATYNELKRVQNAYTLGKAAEVAVLRESIKEKFNAATFDTRELATYLELSRISTSYASGKAAEISVLKEANKEKERAAAFDTRQANAFNELIRVHLSYNTLVGSSIALLKEENKAIEQNLTFQARQNTKLQELTNINKSLKGGTASNIILMQEENRALEQSISYTAKLANEKEHLRQVALQLNGGMAEEVARMTASNSLTERAIVADQKLAFATGDVTRAIYAKMVADEQALSAMNKEITFAGRMAAQYKELQQSLEYYTIGLGKQHAELSALEKLERKKADLMAKQTSQYRALAAEVAKLERELQGMNATILGLNNTLGSGSQAMAGLRSALYGLGVSFGMYTSATLLMSAAVYGLVRATREMITAGANYEDGITRVAALSSKAGFHTVEYSETLEALSSKAVEVAATSRFMAHEVVDAMKELAMAGMEASEIIYGIESVMNLAAIGAISFGEAADISTNIMMGFQLTVEELTNVIDIMAVASTDSNQTIQQMGNAMSYAAPVAESFGVSLQFVAAATEVLANAGIRSSRAGTGLRRIFISLFSPTKRGASAMQALGLAANEATESMSGLEQIQGALPGLYKNSATSTEELVDKLKRLYLASEGATRNVGMLVDIVGVWAAPAFLHLVKSMDDGTESLTSITEALHNVTGATEDIGRKLMNTLKADWLVFLSSLEAVQKAIFELNSADMRNLVAQLTGFTQLLAGSKESLGEMVEAVKNLATGLAKLLGALLAFSILSSITAGFVMLRGAVLAVSLATKVLLTDIMAVAALGTSVTLLGASLTGVAGVLALLAKRLFWPVALAAGIYALVNSFFDLGGAISGVFGFSKELKKEMAALKEQAEKTFENLLVVNPETGMSGLGKMYSELKKREEELIDLKRQSAEGEQWINDQLEFQIELRDDLKKEISEAHKDLKASAQAAILPALIKVEVDYDEALAKLNRIKEMAKGTSSFWATFIAPRSIAEQEAKLAELLASRTKLERRYMLAVGTTAEQMKVVNAEYEESSSKLKKLGDQQANLAVKADGLRLALAQASAAGLDTSGIRAQMEAVSRDIEIIAAAQAVVKEEMELLNNLKQVDASSFPTSLEEYLRFTKEMTEAHNKLRDAMYDPSGIKESQNAVDTLTKLIVLNDKIARKQLEIKKAVSNAEIKGLSIDTPVVATELKKLYADLAGLTDDFNKALTDNKAKLVDLDETYNSASKAANTLSEALVGITGWYSAGRYDDINAATEAFKEQLVSVLELNEKTGKLTKSSEAAIAKLRVFANGVIVDITKQLDDLKKAPGDINSTEIGILEKRLESLRAIVLLTDTDLAALVRDQEKGVKATKDLSNMYEGLITILELLGKRSAALFLKRKAELAQAEKGEKVYLKLKYALEDILQVQEDLQGTADFTRSLGDTFAGLDTSWTTQFGESFVSWFDADKINPEVNAVKLEIGAAMEALVEFGTTATETFTRDFDTLDNRLTSITERIKAASEAIVLSLSRAEEAVSVGSGAASGGSGGSYSGTMPSSVYPDAATGGLERDVKAFQNIYTALDSVLAGVNNYQSLANAINPAIDEWARGVGSAMEVAEEIAAFDPNLLLDSGGAVRFSSVEVLAGVLEDAVVSVKGNLTDLASAAVDPIETMAAPLQEVADTVNDVQMAFEEATPAADEFFWRSASTDSTDKTMTKLELLKRQTEDLVRVREKAENQLAQLRAIGSATDSGTVLSQSQQEEANRLLTSYGQSLAYIAAREQERLAVQDKMIASGELAKYQYRMTDEQLKELGRTYGSTKVAVEDFRVTKAKLTATLEAGLITQGKYNKLLEEEALTKVIATKGTWSAYWAGLKGDMQDFSEFSVDVFDSFRDTLVDALVDGEFKFDDFVDTIKRKLAEMAINTIVVNVIGNITGLTGTLGALTGATSGATGVAGAAGTATSGLSGLSTLGKIGSAWSWLNSNSIGTSMGQWASGLSSGAAGPLTETGTALASASNISLLGSSIAGGLAGYFAGTSLFGDSTAVQVGSGVGGAGGAMAGATYGSVFGPVGTVLGGILGGILGGSGGGFLGSLFGDDSPRFGGYATSFSGYGFEDNVKAKGSFGLNFGISDKGSKNMKAAEYQEVLDGMAAVSDAMSAFYGADLSEAIKNKLWQRLGDFNDWGDDLEVIFQKIFGTILDYGADASDGPDSQAFALRAAMEGLGGLTGSVEEMAQKIEDSISIVQVARESYGRGFGKLLGMADDLEFNDLSKASRELAKYVQHFAVEGESAGETLSKMVSYTYNLTAAMGTAGDALEDFTGSGYDFIEAAYNFNSKLAYYGSSIDALSTQQDNYYSNFFDEEEQAAIVRRAAMDAIEEMNEAFGLSGDAMIDTKEEFRAMIESLDLTTDSGQDAYIQLMNVVDAFIALESAAGSVAEFMKNITPEDVTGANALKEMIALFESWGLTLPATSGALYDLIEANVLTEAQIEILAEKYDSLVSAWDYLATLQEAVTDNLIDALEEAYDAAVDLANEKSEDTIESMRAASETALEDLEAAYDLLVEGIETQIEDLEDALGDFEDIISDVADALESLLQQTEGPDVTRQRYLEMAKDAITQISSGGEVPDNMSDIISQLSNVDQNDFANREDWMAAIRENEAVLSELQGLASNRKSGIDGQIELLEQQLEQEKALYEAAVEAENDRLERAIEAEEIRLEKELAALEDEFEKNKKAIEDAGEATVIELLTQTKLLEQLNLNSSGITDLLSSILEAIVNGTYTGDPNNPVEDTAPIDRDAMVKIIDDMALETRRTLWESIKGLVSNDGAKGLPLPELGFTSNYDKISRLLDLWKTNGLMDGTDIEDIRALLDKHGVKVPGFAKGGKHRGGWRMVGELGPELEYTGSSQILSNSALDKFLSSPGVEGTDYSKYVPTDTGGQNDELLAEVRALREEVAALRADANAGNRAVATNTAKANAMMERWEQIGMPQSRDDIYEVTP